MAQPTWAEKVLENFDHKWHLTQAMRRGGGFMGLLAEALLVADSSNALRILTTWQDKLEPMYPITQGVPA